MPHEPNAHEPGQHRYGGAEGHKHEPDEAAIRDRAHAIWVSEGMPEGREVDHWMRARRELEQEAEHK